MIVGIENGDIKYTIIFTAIFIPCYWYGQIQSKKFAEQMHLYAIQKKASYGLKVISTYCIFVGILFAAGIFWYKL
jgi:hypothetical protein